MKPFTTFREDLASGRPAKKPVSSNLLKQRAIANKKALDTGFMKLTPQERAKESKRLGEEKKNCGCGQDPCITYGKKKMKESYAQTLKKGFQDPKKLNKNMKKKEVTKNPDGSNMTYGQKLAANMKESSSDNYNPEISDKRTKEKLKKAGLPPESPKVMETIIRDALEEKKKGLDGKACWKGYKLAGTKKKGNRTVDNCVPVNEISDHLKTRYIHKAMGDIDNKERASQLADKQGAPASVGKSLSKSTGKRRKGIARARANLERPIREGKKPVVHSTKPDSLKMVKIKYNKPIKTKVTDIGPGGKEVVRKDWSEGIERDPKSNSFNRTKSKKTKVKLGTKNGKEIYGVSTAPQGFPSLREQQMQIVTNLDFNESLGMLVSRGMKKVQRMADDVAQKVDAYDKSTKGAMSKTYNPVSGKNIAKRIDKVKASQKKRLT